MLACLTLASYSFLWFFQRSLFASNPASGGSALVGADLGETASLDAAVAWGAAPIVCATFVWLVLRAPALQRAGLTPAVLALPAVVGIAMWVLPPTLSDDVLSYLSHGWLAATSGGNPYVDASKSVAEFAYGGLLRDQGWTAVHPATPYGPLWTLLERVAYVLSGNAVPLGVLLMKVPALTALVAVGALIFQFLRQHRPDSALRGCLLFVANPLVLVELAGDGHNDGLLAALLLGAVLATANRKAFTATLLLTLAVLVKSSALPFAIPIAVHLFAQRGSIARLIPKALLGTALGTTAGALLIAPFWRGAATLSGLRSGGTLTGWSVAGVLRHVAELAVGKLDVPEPLALLGAQATLALLLGAGSLWFSRSAETVPGLLRSSVAVSLVVLLLLPIGWPWYGTLPVALLALHPDGLAIIAVVVFAVTSRLGAPLGDAAGAGLLTGLSLQNVMTLLVQTVPAVTGLTLEHLRDMAIKRRLHPPIVAQDFTQR